MKIIKTQQCKIDNCDCGWNILIGGKDREELEELTGYVEKTLVTESGCHACGAKYSTGKLTK